MTPNPALMTLPEEMNTYLHAVREFQKKDAPPLWSHDEYRRYEDMREDLLTWKAGLLERIEEELVV